VVSQSTHDERETRRTAPNRGARTALLAVATVAAALGARLLDPVARVDRTVVRRIWDLPDAWEASWRALVTLGSLAAVLPAVLALWVTTQRIGAGVRLGLAALLARATTHVLKVVLDQPRPNLGTGRVPRELVDDPGWPSSHAAIAFAMAAVAARVLGRRWSVLLYAIAALVALGRVYLGVHFVSDVVAGGGIGMLCGVATRERR